MKVDKIYKAEYDGYIDIGNVCWEKYKCTACNKDFIHDYRFGEFQFCPHCGARIEIDCEW